MTSSDLYENIGSKLHAARKAKGLTLSEMSERLSKSVGTISKYEKGEIEISIDVLIDACTILNLDIAALLPDTVINEGDADILKYKNFYIPKLYIYWYNKAEHIVKEAVIENSNMMKHSEMYFGSEGSPDYHQSDFYYQGFLNFSETSTVYGYANTNPPFDRIFVRLPSLTRLDSPRTGSMSCVTYYYQHVTAKIRAYNRRVLNPDSIREDLMITSNEISECRRTNLFTIL